MRGDAVGGEVVDGAGQERRAGRALLVGQDLGVGQPGVVVDQRVDVVEADPGSRSGRRSAPCCAAVGPPAAAVGDPAELLDVHVDQLAGPVAFVADRGGLRGPDHLTGDRVAARQVGHCVAAQDPGDRPRRRRRARRRSSPGRAARGGAARRSRRSTSQPGSGSGIECGREDRSRSPASPSAAYRSIQVFTHLRETPIAAAMWAWGQPAWCRWTISSRPWNVVRALPWDTRTSGWMWALDKPHPTRRFSSRQRRHAATNVLAGYT